MKLMISSQGETLESVPNLRFGRCPYFIQYDLSDNSCQAYSNRAVAESGGAGVAAAQFMIDHEITTVISGRFGPNAYRALSAAGIKMFTFDQSLHTIQEVINAYQSNLLSEVC